MECPHQAFAQIQKKIKIKDILDDNAAGSFIRCDDFFYSFFSLMMLTRQPSDQIQPVCVLDDEKEIPSRSTRTVAGWGRMDEGIMRSPMYFYATNFGYNF
jgi:hypothetical protein